TLSSEEQRVRLLAFVSRHLEPATAERVAPFIGEIAGVRFPEQYSPALLAARQDPRLMADQILAAWLDLIDAECTAGPVLLVMATRFTSKSCFEGRRPTPPIRAEAGYRTPSSEPCRCGSTPSVRSPNACCAPPASSGRGSPSRAWAPFSGPTRPRSKHPSSG